MCRHNIIPALCFFFLVATTPLKAQDDSDHLYAVALNNASLKSFDVLCVWDTLKDISADDYEKSSCTVRMRFDPERKRYLVLSKTINETILGSESKPVNSMHARAFVSLDGTHKTRDLPQRLLTNTGDIYDALYRAGATDFRMVGIGKFPQAYSKPQTLGSFDSLLAVLEGNNQFEQINSAVGKVVIRNSVPSLTDPDERSETTYSISQKSLMPESMSNTITTTSGGKPESTRLFQEEYTWNEVSGIYVPTRVVSDALSYSLPKEYRQLSARERHERRDELAEKDVSYIQHTIYTTARFHWFSVNQEIPEEDFSLRPLTDIAAAEVLLDPRQSGADDLIDR